MQPDPVQLNIDGASQLIGSTLNKIAGDSSSNDYDDALSLKLSDEELLKLKSRWIEDYKPYETKLKTKQDRNKTYYLGTQNNVQSPNNQDLPVASNLIFEAEETFIPAAMSKNPEPVVYADNTRAGKAISDDVKTMLQYHADVLALRRKLAKTVRQWSINYIGVLKHGWDNSVNDIYTEVIKPQDMIFDKDGYIDELGNFVGKYVGERKKATASKLIEMFPKKKDEITVYADGKDGLVMEYIEWWTNEMTFSTLKDCVLDKAKNPNWNYAQKEIDEYGVENIVPGENHFARPKMPYSFLSVFSLGDQPHDITTLIEQNIKNQDLINKRIRQIDVNLDHSNNSIVFSGQKFTGDTAKQAADAMQDGRPILVPNADVTGAVERFPAPNLPSDAFNQLNDMSERLRGIFGIAGLSVEGQDNENTVRGKILNQQYDSTRIGGGIGDALEQLADNIFNWWTQLYYVYYDEEHFASVMGKGQAIQLAILTREKLSSGNVQKLVISVSPNSMKPKDEITEQNLAIDLWNAKAMDPISLFTILNMPDPMDMAKKVVMWTTNPQQYAMNYFPEVAPVAPPYGPEGLEQDIPGGDSGSLSATPPNPSLAQVPINSAGMPQ